MKTQYSAHFIARELAEGNTPKVGYNLNGVYSAMDVRSDDEHGRSSWYRLPCYGLMMTNDDIVTNLVRGTKSMPPSIRFGADENGSFLEVVEPLQLMRLYPHTTAKVLRISVSEIEDATKKRFSETVRAYIDDQ